jgi:hypothetical protein
MPRLEDLKEITDFWSRVDPGGVMPIGQCPICGALCYPTFGYVYELEQRLASTTIMLSALLDWADLMGGWEAPVWTRARRLLTQIVRSHYGGKPPSAT